MPSSKKEEVKEIDFYEYLGVKRDATQQEIKKAYYKKALECHPDRNPNDKDANANFQKLGRIYQVLSDKEKRDFYDQTGTVLGEGFEDLSEVKWDDYWRTLFKKVSSEEIDSYEKTYKFSEQEQKDLKDAYIKCKGDMYKIMDHVVLADDNDIDRFCRDLTNYIESGELKSTKAFTRTKKSITSETEKKKRKANKEKENIECEDLIQKIRNKNVQKENDFASKVSMVRTKRKKEMESLIAALEKKHGNQKRKEEEPSEEEFLKARERLEQRRKKEMSSSTSKHHAKKRKRN